MTEAIGGLAFIIPDTIGFNDHEPSSGSMSARVSAASQATLRAAKQATARAVARATDAAANAVEKNHNVTAGQGKGSMSDRSSVMSRHQARQEASCSG